MDPLVRVTVITAPPPVSLMVKRFVTKPRTPAPRFTSTMVRIAVASPSAAELVGSGLKSVRFTVLFPSITLLLRIGTVKLLGARSPSAQASVLVTLR